MVSDKIWPHFVGKRKGKAYIPASPPQRHSHATCNGTLFGVAHRFSEAHLRVLLEFVGEAQSYLQARAQMVLARSPCDEPMGELPPYETLSSK